tara:strand:+ start:422 stop:628 length:207 start_codon:yes stop_codon:yes gene_type:complete
MPITRTNSADSDLKLMASMAEQIKTLVASNQPAKEQRIAHLAERIIDISQGIKPLAILRTKRGPHATT